MWSFLLGLLVGLAARGILDLLKEPELPPGFGLSSGRAEAMLEETRQLVRELRDELHQPPPRPARRARSAAGQGG
jgi:hypothetical protein